MCNYYSLNGSKDSESREKYKMSLLIFNSEAYPIFAL